MPALTVAVFVYCTLAQTFFVVEADQFLAGTKDSDLDEKFRNAMEAVMGCGERKAYEDQQVIEKALEPMFRVLPKNGHGNVEWRMLRYLTHRYFTARSNLLIRGFEPSRSVNIEGSDIDGSGMLSAKAPSLADSLLSRHNSQGFNLTDAATVVATLQQLIFDGEGDLLQTVYRKLGKNIYQDLTRREFTLVMQVYLLHWLIGDDETGVNILMQNATLREEVITQWHDIREFGIGMINGLHYKGQHAPKHGNGKLAMTDTYSFDDVHETVGSITQSFASFWATECRRVKEKLVPLDKTNSGRVSLADFYGANMDGHWHFGESQAYLRELGALDESSPKKGPQVIIPNYMQGASNCVVGTQHYLVCCVNECEEYLNAIEDQVGASVASPEEIVDIVSNMTADDDFDRLKVLSPELKTQLQRISETHGGKVPLHGRLFAQWLHYVFPRECPFPHKVGSTSATGVNQFGIDASIAKDDEVRSHAATRSNSSSLQQWNVEEAQRMTQWSEDEELHADYSEYLRAPWELGVGPGIAFYGVAAVGLLVVVGVTKASVPARDALEPDAKVHLV